MTVTPADDLPCRALVELATEHLEGALDPVTERRLVEHLADCSGCQDYVAQVAAVGALAAALADREVPSRLRAALLDAFRDGVRPA